MRILFSHRFYWPDAAPYGTMLRFIGRHFATQGDEVHVFSSFPSYRENGAVAAKTEQLDGMSIRRIKLFRENGRPAVVRLFNVIAYCIALFFQIIRIRPDVVTASTFPPVLAGASASLAARLIRARFIYHVQDIHPEVSQISGGRLGKAPFFQILRALDNQTLRRADAIVVLSPDMANTITERGIDAAKIHIINNPSLDDNAPAQSPPAEYRKPAGTTRLIFAGNIGVYQNLPLLTEGIMRALADRPDIELVFLGDGKALPRLKDKWADHPQVKFYPFLPYAQAKVLMQEADIGLVALTPGLYRVAHPSKVPSYKDLGLAVFALIEDTSELARDLNASPDGASVWSDDAADIEQAITAFLTKFKTNTAKPQTDRADALPDILDKWSSLLPPNT